MQKLAFLKSVALGAAIIIPSLSAYAMPMDDKMAMKPMSKSDKRAVARCEKMTPAAAAKNARCKKLMMMHADHKMEVPMKDDHKM
jgi:hypothetical protein